jgi:hypothetical protein
MSESFRPIGILLSLTVPLVGVVALPGMRALLARLKISVDGPTGAALSLAAGLLWIQSGAMLAGFTHHLSRTPMALWLLIGAVLSVVSGWRHRPRWERPDLEGIRIPVLLASVVVCALLLEATVPPWFADDLVYHLSLPRLFAMSHGYAQPDDNIFRSFPLGWESILSTLFAFGDAPDRFPPFNPRLVTVWTGVGAALATAGLTRALGASRSWAAWAGALLLAVPTFAEFTSLAYVESYLVLLSTLALFFVLRVLDGEEQCIWLAGVLAGASASVKYPGLGICVGLTLLMFGSRDEGRPGRLLRFILVGACVGSPFYLRNAVERGNPFFPTLYGVFGGSGWDSWRAVNYAGILEHYGEGHDSWSDWVLLPWRLLAAHDPRSGFESFLGPFVAVGAFAALLLVFRSTRSWLFSGSRHAAPVGWFVLFWFLFWACTTQQGRMFLPAVPALVALGATALDSLSRARPKLGRAFSLVAVVLSLGAAGAAERTRWSYQETTKWLTRALDSDGLLSLMLPDTWPIERDLEQVVPLTGKVWLVWMHDYNYYLRRPWKEDQIFEDYRFSTLLETSRTPSDLTRSLAQEGITHVLINHRFFLSDGSADVTEGRTDRLRARFQEVIAARALVPVLQRRASGVAVTLYAVRPPG